MSGTIWFIAEDKDDVEVVKVILKAKGIPVRVALRSMTSSAGGIFRLVEELEVLILEIKKIMAHGDCIAVLHDADVHTQPERAVYHTIKQICAKHKIKEIVASDAIEAWLLADSGVMQSWLKEKAGNYDETAHPKEQLDSLLKRKGKLRYQGKGRREVWKHIDGSGDKYSPSLREALKHLENAPCVQP